MQKFIFLFSSCFKGLVSYSHSAATDSINHTQEAQDHPSNHHHRHSMTYHSDPEPHREQLCYHLEPQHLYSHESDFRNSASCNRKEQITSTLQHILQQQLTKL